MPPKRSYITSLNHRRDNSQVDRLVLLVEFSVRDVVAGQQHRLGCEALAVIEPCCRNVVAAAVDAKHKQSLRSGSLSDWETVDVDKVNIVLPKKNGF